VNILRHALGAETATLPVAAVMILPGFWRCSGARSCPPPISSDAGLSWRGHWTWRTAPSARATGPAWALDRAVLGLTPKTYRAA